MASRSRWHLDLDLDLDYICEKLCRFYNFRNDFFFLCVFKIKNVQVIQIDENVAKWYHQMLQNDVIKCCKIMSPHSNEPATWGNCVSRRHFLGLFMKNSNNIFICIYQQTTTSVICIGVFEGKGVKMVVKGGRTDFVFLASPTLILHQLLIW